MKDCDGGYRKGHDKKIPDHTGQFFSKDKSKCVKVLMCSGVHVKYNSENDCLRIRNRYQILNTLYLILESSVIDPTGDQVYFVLRQRCVEGHATVLSFLSYGGSVLFDL